MTKAYEPELGQAAFGNPARELECPEYIEALLDHLGNEIQRVVRNVTQKPYEPPTGNVGGFYINDTFAMRSYYWGECVCGFEQRDWAWSEAHEHAAACWQHKWKQVNEEFKDKRRWEEPWRSRELARAKELGWPFDRTDGIAVYCDCGYDRDYAEWRITNDHAPDCPTILPNFRCGDFEVSWYKYLGRGMSMNRAVSEAESVQILTRCLESVRRDEQDRLADARFG